MKLISLITVLALTGCANMTPGQKTAATIIGVVVVGSIVASSSSGGSNSAKDENCFIIGDGIDGTLVCR